MRLANFMGCKYLLNRRLEWDGLLLPLFIARQQIILEDNIINSFGFFSSKALYKLYQEVIFNYLDT